MFRSRIFWRLYAGYVAVIVISTIIVGVLISRQVTENSLREISDSLAVRSELLSEIARPALLSSTDRPVGAVLLQNVITQLGKNTGSRLSVISADGTVIADSQEIPSNMDNHFSRPEVIDARSNGYAIAARYSNTLHQQMMYSALTLTENNELIGFVRVSIPLSTIDKKLEQLRLIVLVGALVAAISAMLLGLYFARLISTPLSKMTEIAEAISNGDYKQRINIDSKDEIGVLAKAFNRMARNSVTRMTKITADHNRLSRIFEGMVEGVIAVDQHQKISHINQAAANLLGLSLENCLNKPLWEQVRAREINDALELVIENNNVVKSQLRQPLGVGDLVVDIYAASLLDAEKNSLGAVVVLHDISEVDRLERIRSDFVANASHELKTPITAIRGLTETIIDDDTMSSSVRKNFIGKIHSQSMRLSSLVTDLLAISRLESGQDTKSFQSFDFSATVRRSITTCTLSCQEKGLALNFNTSSCVDERIMVNGDQQELSQLVDNLLDNAVKYTPAGGHIDVHLLHGGDQITLSVADSGIGISSQNQQRIFERFYRVDKARSRDLGGTGLGLSIVKNIAEQHGGSVSLSSASGSGSTFVVTLPGG
jgi:two-component system phosphate regulon sensor histidine kinase PhoR